MTGRSVVALAYSSPAARSGTFRRDLTPAGLVLGRGDGLLDRGRAQAADRLGERGLREQRVGARYPPPGVHDLHSSPAAKPGT
jgi:hypothetical protein